MVPQPLLARRGTHATQLAAPSVALEYFALVEAIKSPAVLLRSPTMGASGASLVGLLCGAFGAAVFLPMLSIRGGEPKATVPAIPDTPVPPPLLGFDVVHRGSATGATESLPLEHRHKVLHAFLIGASGAHRNSWRVRLPRRSSRLGLAFVAIQARAAARDKNRHSSATPAASRQVLVS